MNVLEKEYESVIHIRAPSVYFGLENISHKMVRWGGKTKGESSTISSRYGANISPEIRGRDPAIMTHRFCLIDEWRDWREALRASNLRASLNWRNLGLISILAMV